MKKRILAVLLMVAIVAVPLLLGSLAQRKRKGRGQTRSQRYAAQSSSGYYSQSRRSKNKKKRRRR